MAARSAERSFALTPGKRVLYLTKDPERIRQQLAGTLTLRMSDVSPDELLDDINTDAMTPAWVCFDFDPEAIAQNAYAGLVVNGQRLTTNFLGGLFSLDGIHPTNTGYAVIANAFIKTLDQNFAAGIPPVSVEQVAMTDPLVLPVVGRPPSALGHLSPGLLNALRALFSH